MKLGDCVITYSLAIIVWFASFYDLVSIRSWCGEGSVGVYREDGR